jgi:hypothetical protein
VLHFPLRSLKQCEDKYMTAFEAWSNNPKQPNPYHEKAFKAWQAGRMTDFYASLAVDDRQLETGLKDGSLTLDTRLRDVLRQLRQEPDDGYEFALPTDGRHGLQLQPPTIVDDASYAVDASTMAEADVIRLQRRVDQLEQRLAHIEQSPPARLFEAFRRHTRHRGAA